MTKILVVNDHGFVNGGGAQVAISSLNALAEAGLDVTFVSAVAPVESSIDRDLVHIVNFGLQDLQGNPSAIDAAVSGIWNFKTKAQFDLLLNDFSVDDTIIHIHTWVSAFSSSIVSVAKRRGFRVVITLHDYSSVCPNGGLYDYPKRRHCDLIPMSFGCVFCNCDSRSYNHKIWRVGRQFIQNRVILSPGAVDLFIAVSEYQENLLRARLPSKAIIKRVGNPINIEKMPAANVALNKDFTFIGRLAPEKGGVLFAEAANISGISPVFVGAGSEEYRIKEICPDARFLGWQDNKGVLNAISRSRAVVFPTLLHECQPLTVLEAAAIGVPVIASDQCAARDVIINGETGLLFRARDSVDLANKLSCLNDRPDYAANLAASFYEKYWKTPSSLSTHVDELLDCYSSVLGRKLFFL